VSKALISELVLGEERAAPTAPEGRVVWVAEILVARLIDENEKGVGRKLSASSMGHPSRIARLEASYPIPWSLYYFSCIWHLVIDFQGLVRFFMV
jgi:hypothetical protein